MDDVGLSGLYTRLKDKQLPLPHKLQLVRFCWKSTQVVIPNKEQVLIDLLTGYLLNKKKYQLTDDEVGSVWKCLYDVLRTKKAHLANEQGQGLVIKQSICSVMLEALSSAGSSGVDCLYLEPLIGSCHSIITSPTLSYVFTARLDQMLSLLAALCSLLVKHLDNDCTRDRLSELIKETAKNYLKVQKTAPNQKQILQWGCANFLPSFLCLWSLVQPSQPLSDIVDCLCEVTEQTLFHKDHYEAYAVYLNMKYGTTDSRKKPVKSVEQVFSTIETALKDKTRNTSALYLFIPVLFESFLKAECHNSSQLVAHHMMLECCNLIGVKFDSTALSESADLSVVINGVNQLLQIVQRYETYNESADEKGKQLQLYRHLVSVLLENKCFTPDWYSCFTVLLQLNHQILEPSLPQILLTSWLNCENQFSESVTASLDVFLQELVTTYQKLRQFQKFMTKLLDTLKTCTNLQFICTPSGFLKRYGEIVQSLPQGMTVDIWRLFVKHLIENHVTGQDQGHFQGVCTLFCEFLSNVKVADYSTTEITATAVQDLMVTMETDILVPLLQACKAEKVSTMLACLQLCYVWGEMSIMLAQYTRHRASSFTAQPQVHTSTDLSFVHGYLRVKDWMIIYKRIYKTGDLQLQYAWDMLELQQIRAHLLFSSNSAIAMTTMVDLPANVTPDDVVASWYPSVYQVNSSNYLVAKWHLLVTNMPAIYTVLSPEQCSVIAGFIIQTAGQTADRKSDTITISATTDYLLTAPWMKEFSTLQSCLVTSLWKSFGECFATTVKSGKKRKSSTSTADLLFVLQSLGDSDTDWLTGLTSETAEVLQKTADGVEKILQMEDHHGNRPDYDKLQIFLQVLQKLPDEQLSACDQLRCLFGLLSLSAYIMHCESKNTRTSQDSKIQNEASPCQREAKTQKEARSNQMEAGNQHEAVFTMSLQLMMVILESSGPASVFRLLNIQTCVQWLQRLQNEALCHNSSTRLRLSVFVEMCCFSMVKDYQVLEKLPSCLPQLTSAILGPVEGVNEAALFITSCFLQDLSKLLNRPYLKDNLRAICSEMFVSMATALLKNIKAITSHSHKPVSGHVVKCLTVIIATNLVAKVKDQLMSQILKWLNWLLDWCLKILQKNDENHSKLTALDCLLVVFKHHKDLEDSLSPSKKLEIWNQLVTFLQVLLNQETNLPPKNQFQEKSAKKELHEQEIDQSESILTDLVGKETGRSCQISKELNFLKNRFFKLIGEETDQSGCVSSDTVGKESGLSCQHSKELNFVKDISVAKVLHLIRGECKDITSVTLKHLKTSEIKLPPHSLCSSPHSKVNTEAVTSPAAVHIMYRTLVYEGHWESQSSEVILVQIKSVIATMVLTFDLEDFTKVIQGIVEDVSTRRLNADVKKLLCSLFIWQRLLKLDLSQEQAQVIVYAAQNLMSNMQCIVQQLSHSIDDELLLSVVVPVLKAQEQMLVLGQGFMSPQTSVVCLHSCQLLPLGGSSYFPAFSAACSVLDTLLLNHTEAVFKTIPSYLNCAKRLLLSVVQYSSQEKVRGDKEMTECLVDCAHQMERLFTQISTHKVDFGKVAVYVVSDYVTAIQKVTLVPVVKRALVPAVYKMLDLCDKHSIALLHTVLSHGVCEVFKLLYSDYNKYYRYTGKI